MNTPSWLSANKARALRPELGFAAAFDWSFDAVARHFGAKASIDRNDRGSEPIRFFYLKLENNRIAAITSERRAMRGVSLYLPIRAGGRVDWEDYEQIMNSLGIPLEEVFRRGGLVWKRRKPSP